MRPGALSVGGFLGPDERLEAVLQHDATTLARWGVTPAQLAAPLDTLLTTAEKSRSRAAHIGDLKIDITVYPGFQMCPWSADIHHAQCSAGGGVQHASVDWRIRNVRTGQEMRGPGLAVHLIRDHHFFEGPQSPYRIEPEALLKLLGFSYPVA